MVAEKRRLEDEELRLRLEAEKGGDGMSAEQGDWRKALDLEFAQGEPTWATTKDGKEGGSLASRRFT